MVRAAPLIGLAVLAGCQQSSKICPVIPATQPLNPADVGRRKTAIEWDERVNDCIARWATRIAPAPGSTSEIAAAAVGGCVDAIGYQVATQAAEDRAQRFPIEGDYDERVAARRSEARLLASFYVAAARAGNCKAP